MPAFGQVAEPTPYREDDKETYKSDLARGVRLRAIMRMDGCNM